MPGASWSCPGGQAGKDRDLSAGSQAMASPVPALGSWGGDASSPPTVVGSLEKPVSQIRGFPRAPCHIPTMPTGRSRASSSAGVHCCPQPGPASCQRPADQGRRGCSLATISQPDREVASWSCGEASEHLGHQRTTVSLPAGVRGPREFTLTFPYPPVMEDNPRKLPSPWGSTQRGTLVERCHIPGWVPAAGCRAARLPASL